MSNFGHCSPESLSSDIKYKNFLIPVNQSTQHLMYIQVANGLHLLLFFEGPKKDLSSLLGACHVCKQGDPIVYTHFFSMSFVFGSVRQFDVSPSSHAHSLLLITPRNFFLL